MTIINNIEIDNFEYKPHFIKKAILHNPPIDNVLHVITVISNPCLYARRYILMKEFIERFERGENPHTILYVVELAYENQSFIITDKNNARHLQLRTDKPPIWQKENMINIGIERLLPPDWKAVAWIDADLDFDNPHWAMDALKILNGECDIVQLFSHCLDMDKWNHTMNVFSSAGYVYSSQQRYCSNGLNYSHPGYAWAINRSGWERIGGKLFDKAILGSGDNIMLFSILENGVKSINENSTEEYKNMISEFENKIKTLKFGYVPGMIRHYYHGSKRKRGYNERWKILVKHGYNPLLHVEYDSNGILIPSDKCPRTMLDEIFGYFASRDEDDIFASV